MWYTALILVICVTAAYGDMSALTSESVVVTNNPADKQPPNIRPIAASGIASPVSSNSKTIVIATPASPIAASAPANTAATARPLRHRSAKRIVSKSSLSDMTFDFNYSGDISGLPLQLRDYDNHLTILHALGTKKDVNVNISLQGAKIDDVTDAIAAQTNDQVHLIFSAVDNSVRLNYRSVIDVGHDAISESLKWQQGGAPRPILKADGVVRFPYGEYQPVVTCQPLNLCDIELQAGEDVQGIVIGDSQRWNEGDNGIPLVYSGIAGNLTPHLVLKPSQGGLDTTLMVTTSKRTYMLRIKSAFNGYVARAGFYYPADMIQKFTENKAKLKNTESLGTQALNPDVKMALIDLSKVNYAYTISGDDYIWKPTQIFDDGVSVYIQLPDSVSSRSLPGLCVMVDGDDSETKCEMVNFRFNDHFYIVDKLFNQAKLINGYGDYMQTITLKRKADKPGFWSRLFGG